MNENLEKENKKSDVEKGGKRARWISLLITSLMFLIFSVLFVNNYRMLGIASFKGVELQGNVSYKKIKLFGLIKEYMVTYSYRGQGTYNTVWIAFFILNSPEVGEQVTFKHLEYPSMILLDEYSDEQIITARIGLVISIFGTILSVLLSIFFFLIKKKNLGCFFTKYYGG
jgi:hypothetical protein